MRKALWARLTIFFFSLIWLIFYLWSSVIMFDLYREAVITYAEVSKDAWQFKALESFYVFTVVVAGMYFVYRAFRFIGKWERK